MKCPCEDCLCVPICRHKRYIPLMKCSILHDYLMKPSISSSYNKIEKITSILDPTRWTYREEAIISILSKQNEN